MVDLRELLAPHYPAIKAIHVIAAALWSFSTAVAYSFYLKPAFRRVQRNPHDPYALETRNRLMEAFDRGALVEHVAFAILVATALLMLWLGGFDLTRWTFAAAMLWIGFFVILPMEVIDIHLSHLGDSKKQVRKAGDMERYERMMRQHWIFLRVTEPLIMVLVPLMFVLGIVKPF